MRRIRELLKPLHDQGLVEDSLNRKARAANFGRPGGTSGCDEGPRGLGDLRNRLRHPFRFILQRQIGLRAMTQSSASTMGILLTWCSCIRRSQVSIFSPSRHASGKGDELFDLRGFRVHAFCYDRAAQIAVGNHADKLPRLTSFRDC